MEQPFLNRFLQGVTASLTGTLFQVGAGFAVVVIASRWVPKSEFGEYVLLVAIIAVFGMLSGLCIDNIAVTQVLSGADEGDKEQIASTAVTARITVDILLGFWIFLFPYLIPSVSALIKIQYWNFFGAALFLTGSLNGLLLRIFQGFHCYKDIATQQILSGAIKVTLGLILIYSLNLGVKGLLFATIFSNVTTVMYQAYVSPFRYRVCFNRMILRRVFLFGVPLGANTIVSFMFTKLDRMLLAVFLAPASVASYEIASKIPECVRCLYDAYHAVYFPNSSELYSKNLVRDAERLMNHSLRIIVFIATFAAFTFFIFKDEVVVLLFSQKYAESAVVMAIMMFALTLDMIGNILGTTMVACGNSKSPFKINIIAALGTVLLNLLLIPSLGIVGAALTAVIVRISTIPLNVAVLHGNSIRVYHDKYVRPIVVLLLCYTASIVWGPTTMFLKAVFISMFIVASFILETITIHDLNAFMKMIRYSSLRVLEAKE